MAEAENPRSYMTVGRTCEMPQPPIAWNTQVRMNAAVIGSLKTALNWPVSQVFEVEDGCVFGRLFSKAILSGVVKKHDVSG